MMFFHIGPMSFRFIHEWMSICFVAVCLIHIVINFKVLLAYMRKPSAWIPIAIGLLLLVFLSMNMPTQHRGGRPQAAGTSRSGD
jgi:hypothetical protein